MTHSEKLLLCKMPSGEEKLDGTYHMYTAVFVFLNKKMAEVAGTYLYLVHALRGSKNNEQLKEPLKRKSLSLVK